MQNIHPSIYTTTDPGPETNMIQIEEKQKNRMILWNYTTSSLHKIKGEDMNRFHETSVSNVGSSSYSR